MELELTSLTKGNMENGAQIFCLFLKDSKGDIYEAPFACRYNYADAMEKAWRRLIAIKIPEEAQGE